MASRQSIIDLIRELNLSIPEEQAGAIAGSCGDFYAERVIKAMSLEDEKDRTAKKLLAIIKKHSKVEKRSFCGHCNDSILYLLDRELWNTLHRPILETTIFAPKAGVDCPVCGKNKSQAQAVINAMDDEERGWTWVLLYDFYHNRIIQPGETAMPAAEFEPSAFWQIQLNPFLTVPMRNCLEWCEGKRIVSVPKPADAPRTEGEIKEIAQEYIRMGAAKMKVTL